MIDDDEIGSLAQPRARSINSMLDDHLRRLRDALNAEHEAMALDFLASGAFPWDLHLCQGPMEFRTEGMLMGVSQKAWFR